MKLENIKGQKLIEPIYFLFFERKILVLGKMPKISPKTGFFNFSKKLIHSCFFFHPKMVPKRVLCDSQKKKKCQFFDHQYL